MSSTAIDWIRCPNCDADHLVEMGDGILREYGKGKEERCPEDPSVSAYSFTFVVGNEEIVIMGSVAETVRTKVVEMVAAGLIQPRYNSTSEVVSEPRRN